MENGFSPTDLIGFLDWSGDKGKIKKNTASAQKAACNQIFGVLDEEERNDLRKIELDSVFQRYKNLNPTKLTPETLKTYRSRVDSAVTSFLSWREDPENWKPGIQERTSRKKTASLLGSVPKIPTSDAQTLNLPFPVRGDLTITVLNVPRDLKKNEARRLGAFLEAFAVDDSSLVGAENQN